MEEVSDSTAGYHLHPENDTLLKCNRPHARVLVVSLSHPDELATNQPERKTHHLVEKLHQEGYDVIVRKEETECHSAHNYVKISTVEGTQLSYSDDVLSDKHSDHERNTILLKMAVEAHHVLRA